MLLPERLSNTHYIHVYASPLCTTVYTAPRWCISHTDGAQGPVPLQTHTHTQTGPILYPQLLTWEENMKIKADILCSKGSTISHLVGMVRIEKKKEFRSSLKKMIRGCQKKKIPLVKIRTKPPPQMINGRPLSFQMCSLRCFRVS